MPSTSASTPLVASAASSAVGRSSSVTFSTNGVRNAMYRDIIDRATPKMSGSYILDDVLPEISAGNHEHLPQGQFTRASFLFVPRFFE